jgi:GNAT superfamily N-acetyltransferase
MKAEKPEIQGSVVVVQESDIDETLDKEIRELLVTSFDWTPEFQERSYWHLKPVTRFIYKDSAGRLLGHSSFIEKRAVIGNDEIKIAGSGATAVHPEFRNSGIGKELIEEAVRYAKKQGYDLIAGFAKNPASIHICIKSGAVPTKDIFLVTYPDGGEVLKPHTLVWPLSEEKYQLILNSDQPINLGYGSW